MKKLMALIALATTLVAETLTLSGTVISDNQKMITSRFMGFVTSVNVSEGDRVKKGQVLYTIDSREIDSAKRQAEAGLQMSKNQYANVEINLERYKTLYAKDMVAKYEEALILYQKLIVLLPENPAVDYNIACIYARQNRPEKSVHWLKKAVAKGFNDLEHIKNDSDFDNIRDSSHYREFLANH